MGFFLILLDLLEVLAFITDVIFTTWSCINSIRAARHYFTLGKSEKERAARRLQLWLALAAFGTLSLIAGALYIYKRHIGPP